MLDFRGVSAGVNWTGNVTSAMNSTTLSQAAAANTTNLVINELRFAASKSIRTSTIVLATFNTITAFATAAGIWYECHSSEQRSRRGKEKTSKWTCVRGPEVFPFTLSIGIMVQGIVFAISQSQGMRAMFQDGCTVISHAMWPALFIVPFIQLVFGLEVAVRGLQSEPFKARGKKTVAICVSSAAAGVVIAGLSVIPLRAPDYCFASLFWFVAQWAEGGFAILLGVPVVLIVCVVIVYLKLSRNANIENSERVLASRSIYYLVLGIISNLFMVPFFAFLTFSSVKEIGGGSALNFSMIATVVANLSGLTTGGLHLFLRSSTITTIGPKDKLAEYEREQLKHKIRMASISEGSGQVLQSLDNSRTLRHTESQQNLVRYEKEEEAAIESPVSRTAPQYGLEVNPLRSNAVLPATSIPRIPDRAQLPPSTTITTSNLHSRKPSYSLFPAKNAGNSTSVALLPATTYSPVANNGGFAFDLDDLNSTLTPPPPITGFSRHRRDSSMASSATVQIGLRFSNVDDMPRLAGAVSNDAQETYNLGCPNVIERSPLASIVTSGGDSWRAERPSAIVTTSTESSEAARMKALPPTPKTLSTIQSLSTPGNEMLSPAVYSPANYSPKNANKAKLPSPRGVGFSVLKRTNTTPVQNMSRPVSPAPRNRGNSDATEARGDWI